MDHWGGTLKSLAVLVIAGSLLLGAGCSSDEGTQQPQQEFDPPSGLTYINGSASVTLSWTASSDAANSDFAGYAVYRSGSSMAGLTGAALSALRLNQSPVSVTSYTDNSVQLGQKYFYAVRAVKDNGDLSQPTNEINTAARTEFSGITLAEFESVDPSGLSCAEGTAYPMRSGAPDFYERKIDLYLGTDAEGDAASGQLVLKSAHLVQPDNPSSPWVRESGLMLLGNDAAARDAGTAPGNAWQSQVELGASPVGSAIAVRLPEESGGVHHYAKIIITSTGSTSDEKRALVVRVAYQPLPDYIRFSLPR